MNQPKTSHIMDGKMLSQQFEDVVKSTVSKGIREKLRAPKLAVIQIGNNPASNLYIKHKMQACKRTGIGFVQFHFETTCQEDQIISLIDELNHADDIDAILVQFPIPTHISTLALMLRIHPSKDADGLHPINQGKLLTKSPSLTPCTPQGIMHLLHHYHIDIPSKHVVIVSESTLVGRPMAMMLLNEFATTTICHHRTTHLQEIIEQADILIVAIGQSGVINSDWIKPQATVIDVGINHNNAGQIIGDIDFVSAQRRAAWITPVPGGVGPMTVTCLLENTITAWKIHLHNSIVEK